MLTWEHIPPPTHTPGPRAPQAPDRTEMGDSAPGQLSLKKEAASMAAMATTNGLLTAGEGSSGGRADQTLEEEEEEYDSSPYDDVSMRSPRVSILTCSPPEGGRRRQPGTPLCSARSTWCSGPDGTGEANPRPLTRVKVEGLPA